MNSENSILNNLLIIENTNKKNQEVSATIDIINGVYDEWKKTDRRKNAIDIITSASTKLSRISPEIISFLPITSKNKLIVCMIRCMDLPPWKDPESKKTVYRKLYKLLKTVQYDDSCVGTGGNVRETIMSRLSAAIFFNNKDVEKTCVIYEPVISSSYINYIFGDDKPLKCIRMHSLSLPENFNDLIEILKINHGKANKITKK